MKSIIKKSWLLGVVLLSVALPSCEDVTELNVDPNQPVSVPAANLLTQAEYTLYNLQQGTGLNAGWGLLMTQQWAENEYADGSRYEVDANTFNGSWGTFYTGVLNELNVARTIIEADANVPADIKTTQIAIVDIITVDAFHSVT
ncbi:MAG: SusD/RagB family nutrient-binding outer membrane lipoprotein, partial [Spirosomataceae bacterium]